MFFLGQGHGGLNYFGKKNQWKKRRYCGQVKTISAKAGGGKEKYMKGVGLIRIYIYIGIRTPSHAHLYTEQSFYLAIAEI